MIGTTLGVPPSPDTFTSGPQSESPQSARSMETELTTAPTLATGWPVPAQGRRDLDRIAAQVVANK